MRVIVAVETITHAWHVDVDLNTGSAMVRREHRLVGAAMYDGDGRWSQVDPAGGEIAQILARAAREVARFDAVLRDARTPATFPH